VSGQLTSGRTSPCTARTPVTRKSERARLLAKAAQAGQEHKPEASNATAPQGCAQSAALKAAIGWDLDWFHYTPKWYKPHIVIIAGLSFVLGANLGTEPSLKTTLVASAPVLLGWFLFLYMIPRQFSSFASTWIKEHPEATERAIVQQQEQE